MNILSIKLLTLNKNIIEINCKEAIKKEISKLQGNLETHIRTRMKNDIRIHHQYVSGSILPGQIYDIKGTGLSILTHAENGILRINCTPQSIDNIKDKIFIKTDLSNNEYIDIESFLTMLTMSYDFQKFDRINFQVKRLSLITNKNKHFNIAYLLKDSGIQFYEIELTNMKR